jgi:hypothetical protein
MEGVHMDPRDVKVHGDLIAVAAADPMVFAIGQFMVNCGRLEFETYVWIHGFGAGDPRNKEDAKKELFNARKNRVLRIMNGLPLAPEVKKGVEQVWNETTEVMELRNVIAHSPVMVQHNGPESNPEWCIRVIDARSMGSGNLKEYPKKEIDAMADRVNELNKRLFNLRHVIGGGQIKISYLS